MPGMRRFSKSFIQACIARGKKRGQLAWAAVMEAVYLRPGKAVCRGSGVFSARAAITARLSPGNVRRPLADVRRLPENSASPKHAIQENRHPRGGTAGRCLLAAFSTRAKGGRWCMKNPLFRTHAVKLGRTVSCQGNHNVPGYGTRNPGS